MFDENQPFFANLAIMYRDNFDERFDRKFTQLALRLSLDDLHARKMSQLDYDLVCGGVYDIIRNEEIQFSYIYVEKLIHAAVKLFDTVFDEGENYAVPWHGYWIRETKYIFLAKFIHMVDLDTLKEFWMQCLTEKDNEKAKIHFVNVVKRLKENIDPNCDARSREIFTEAYDWAIKNYSNITYFTASEQTMLTHMPNVAFFANLMRNIEEQYEFWKSDKCIILHDSQSEFEAALAEMHRMISSPNMPKFLEWPSLISGKPKLRALERSTCKFQSSTSSCGIQLCDICLSVMSRDLKNKELTDNQILLRDFITNNISSYFSMDYDSLVSEATMIWDFFMNVDISEEQLKKGKEFLGKIEDRRRERMQINFPSN